MPLLVAFLVGCTSTDPKHGSGGDTSSDTADDSADSGPPCTPVEAVFFDLGETLVTQVDGGSFETIPAAAALLDALAAQDMPLGIITTVPPSYDLDDLRALLVDPTLLDRFEVVLISSMAEADPKPDPAIYAEAVGLLLAPPPIGQTVFVTENLADIADAEPPIVGARAAGMVGVFVSDGGEERLADHVVPSDALPTLATAAWLACLEAEEGDTGGTSDTSDTADCTPTDWFVDKDGDGTGDSVDTVAACDAPVGYVAVLGDCDDADANVYPGAPEACDGRDSDCAGDDDQQMVTVSGGGTYPTVFDAVAASVSGDDIVVCPGVYVEAIVVGHDLFIEGLGTRDDVVLSGAGAPVFTVVAGAFSLTGATVTGGGVDTVPGGAVSGSAADAITIDDCVLTGNTASGGGAVYGPVNGQLTIQGSVLTGNTARFGGAVVASGGAILDSEVSDNHAEGAGGILDVREADPVGLLDLTGTTLLGNTADTYGGGLALGGEVDTLGGTLVLNTAFYGGGGVSTSDQVGTIEGMVISENVALGESTAGGGVYLDSDATVTLRGCTIDHNQAGGWGGGIYTADADLLIDGGAVTANVAATGGGVMIDGWPTLTVLAVDFGSGATENTPSDVHIGVSGAAYTDLGASATVTCDSLGCR